MIIDNSTLRFSGHDTFHCKEQWILKGLQLIKNEEDTRKKNLFLDKEGKMAEQFSSSAAINIKLSVGDKFGI